MTLETLATLGIHIEQDGPWTSVLVVMAPPCDYYMFDALA